MAIQFIASAQGSNATNSPVVITLPSGMQVGDLVLVVGGGEGTTKSIGSGDYTAVGTPEDGQNYFSAYKFMPSPPDTTVTCGAASSGLAAAYVLMVFRGVDTVTPKDTAATGTSGSSTNPNDPAITTVTANSIVVATATSLIGAPAPVAPTGYLNQANVTQAGTVSFAAAMAWKTIISPGVEDPASWTNWPTGAWFAVTMAFRVASPGTLPIRNVSNYRFR